MEISSIIGILLGLVAIIGSQLVESGTAGSVFHPTAAIIVFGGTISAILINFPIPVILQSFISAKKVFLNEEQDISGLIYQMVRLADLTRREGNLALEPIVNGIENPYLRKGIQLIADSASPRVIKEILHTQIDYEEENFLLNARVFEVAGSYAPTFGIIGAVLGLIQVMQHISEPAQLGQGIATAFIATFYGVGIANLILLPIGGKLRIKSRGEIIIKEMILEGVLSIHAGDNPSVVEEKLNSFLSEHQKRSLPDFDNIENEGWQ